MTNKIIFFIALFSYAIVVSQPFMYMLSLKDMQMNLGANSYIEVRKLTDAAMRSNFKFVLYITLLAALALAVVNIKNPGSIVFLSAVIALLAIVADIVMAVKGSMPVNDIINSWSVNNYPADWQHVRQEWFNIFFYRQLTAIVGFSSLLIGAIFGKL